jgi:MFS family permease
MAPTNPWVVAISVMLATFMEVLDTAIASVALPYIAGSLAASNSEATWVLTSYLIANAVVLPALDERDFSSPVSGFLLFPRSFAERRPR